MCQIVAQLNSFHGKFSCNTKCLFLFECREVRAEFYGIFLSLSLSLCSIFVLIFSIPSFLSPPSLSSDHYKCPPGLIVFVDVVTTVMMRSEKVSLPFWWHKTAKKKRQTREWKYTWSNHHQLHTRLQVESLYAVFFFFFSVIIPLCWSWEALIAHWVI